MISWIIHENRKLIRTKCFHLGDWVESHQVISVILFRYLTRTVSIHLYSNPKKHDKPYPNANHGAGIFTNIYPKNHPVLQVNQHHGAYGLHMVNRSAGWVGALGRTLKLKAVFERWPESVRKYSIKARHSLNWLEHLQETKGKPHQMSGFSANVPLNRSNDIEKTCSRQTF